MPIIGLTDKAARLPRLGIIHKGGKKVGNKPGSDLDYFRLESPDKEVMALWGKVYGAEPRQLSCLIPSTTTEDAFPCWLEEWNASGLLRRCDGQQQAIWLAKSNRYNNAPIPCLQSNDTPCNCKQVGRLQVVLPEINRMGYFEVQTHSKWDIMTLSSNLLAVELSLGRLSGIPFLLKREIRSVSTTIGDKKTRVNKSLLSIEVHPNVASKIVAAVEHRVHKELGFLPQELQPALMPSPETIASDHAGSFDEF